MNVYNNMELKIHCGGCFSDCSNEKFKLVDVELIKEKDEYFGLQCYLKLTYEYEDSKAKHLLVVPKLRLPINSYRFEYHQNVNGYYGDVGFGFNEMVKTDVEGVTNGCRPIAFYIKELEKKFTEMTLEDIEKRLGIAIKLVAKKEENK